LNYVSSEYLITEGFINFVGKNFELKFLEMLKKDLISWNNMFRRKTVVGLVEQVKIGKKKVLARIDTGAERSSICTRLLKRAFEEKPPVVRHVTYRTSNGSEKRPVVKVPIRIAGRKIKATFNVTDRRDMTYDVLIGQNILKKDFLIDPRRR